MSMVCGVVGGVDTHADMHVAAVFGSAGRIRCFRSVDRGVENADETGAAVRRSAVARSAGRDPLRGPLKRRRVIP